MKDQITIPVFYHENDEGHKIIDKEYMREYFEYEIKKIYLETKIGRRENWRKTLKEEFGYNSKQKKENEKNR